MRVTLGLVVVLFATTSAWAGVFTPQISVSGTKPNYVVTIPQGPSSDIAIPANSSDFVEWASAVTNVTYGTSSNASYRNLAYAVGPTQIPVKPPFTSGSLDVVNLGVNGQITVTFAQPITDGAGPDFAVFSNGFLTGSEAYLKLATVWVSSDGENFFELPPISDTASPVALYGSLDASNLYNLAGKYVSGYRTPFNLDELAGTSPLLNVNDIQYVRLIDVGSDTLDSNEHPIYESVDTGFNFGGIGVLSAQPVPEPPTCVLAVLAIVMLIPLRRGFRKSPAAIQPPCAANEFNHHRLTLAT